MTYEASDLPPWCFAVAERLQGMHGSGQMPHALLFSGPAGTGKLLTARFLVRLLLGLTGESSEKPGDPHDPAFITRHPDCLLVVPAEDKSSISIDQIRVLTRRLSMTPHTADVKIAVIGAADSMTHEASNALLKTLEEPPGNSIIILISDNHGLLPATIRSRCHRFTFPLPDFLQASEWLRERISGDMAEYLSMSGGSPLQALSYRERNLAVEYRQFVMSLGELLRGKVDFLHVTQLCKPFAVEEVLRWIEQLTRALITFSLLGESTPSRFSKFLKGLDISSNSVDLERLFAYHRFLDQVRRELAANLNQALLVETLLLRWSSLLKTA